MREALIEREVLLDIRTSHHLADAFSCCRTIPPTGRPGSYGSASSLYDHLGGRKRLPGTRVLNLRTPRKALRIQAGLSQGLRIFRLLGGTTPPRRAQRARREKKGARILTRTACTGIRRRGDLWHVEMTDAATGAKTETKARCVVNTAGPWVNDVIGRRCGT